MVIEPRAATDIAAYARWMDEQGSPEGALGWIDAIEAAINSLKSFPARCPLAPESEIVGEDVRQLVFASHRILFVIEEDVVHVLHVRHASRQVGSDEDRIL